MKYKEYKNYESKNGYDINLFSIETLGIPYNELSDIDKKDMEKQYKKL